MYGCINTHTHPDKYEGTFRNHSSNLHAPFPKWLVFLYQSLFQTCSNCWNHQHKVPSTQMKWGRLPQAAKLCNTKPLHRELSSIETPVNARRNPRKLCVMLQNAPQGSRVCYLLTPSFCEGKSVQCSGAITPGSCAFSTDIGKFQVSQRSQHGPLIVPVEAPGQKQVSPRSLDVWLFSCPLDRWLFYQTGLSVLLGVIWI